MKPYPWTYVPTLGEEGARHSKEAFESVRPMLHAAVQATDTEDRASALLAEGHAAMSELLGVRAVQDAFPGDHTDCECKLCAARSWLAEVETTVSVAPKHEVDDELKQLRQAFRGENVRKVLYDLVGLFVKGPLKKHVALPEVRAALGILAQSAKRTGDGT